jgi:isochorismate hydrolase
MTAQTSLISHFSPLISHHDHGYNVGLIVDAMIDRDPDAHRNSLEKIFPRIGETATTDAVLNQLQEQTRPTGMAVHQ